MESDSFSILDGKYEFLYLKRVMISFIHFHTKKLAQADIKIHWFSRQDMSTVIVLCLPLPV